jgi:hypothetical protein
MQLEGTAHSSMARDLVELYTKDGRINGEDDIAACTAATYAGMSSRFIFQRQLDSSYPPFRRFRHGKLRYSILYFEMFLNSPSSADSLCNRILHIGSCAVPRGADTWTGRA